MTNPQLDHLEQIFTTTAAAWLNDKVANGYDEAKAARVLKIVTDEIAAAKRANPDMHPEEFEELWRTRNRRGQ